MSALFSQTRLLLVRHPETEANVARRYLGRGDSPYTERGRTQADALAAAIAAFEPDVVASSPARRALSVALDAAERRGGEALVFDELAEIDFGAGEGLTYGEASRAGMTLELSGGPADAAPFPDAETWGAFRARADRGLALASAVGERVAVVTHGGVIRAALCTALGLDLASGWRFAPATATLTLLSVGPDYAVIDAFGLPPEVRPLG
jgi:broad specificity phosphatase PhoE